MKKNVFTFALALLTAGSAWAQTFTVDNLKYTITDETANTVELTGYVSKPTGTLDIPATVNYNSTTYSMTSIGNSAFFWCFALTQVNIPNSVTSIGDYAFYNCSALTQVTIPNSVTSIGYGAFEDCYALTQVTIPDGVTSIGYYAFEGTALYNNADNWTNNVLYIDNCLIKAKEELSGSYEIATGTRVIADGAFHWCSALTQVTIPNSVTSIGELAFSNCSALTQVTIGNSVTSIGDMAFWKCSALTQVIIPESVTSIGSSAFSYCSALMQVIIPESVTSIGSSAFSYCSALMQVTWNAINCADFSYSNSPFDNSPNITTFTFGEQVEHIPAYLCYGMDKLTQVTLPNSVESIGNDAFYDCSALTQVNIPNSVTSIRDYAFCNCSALTQVTIGNSVTNIGEGAFYDCSALTQVTIGNGVTSIGDLAFYNCSALTQVTIPNSVTSIGHYAFYGCSALAEMTVLATVPPTVGGDAFYNVSRDIPVYVPADALEDYQNDTYWQEFNLHAMPTGLQTPSMPESIRVYGGTLHNPQQLPVSLYDMQGRMVYSGTAATVSQPAGVYVVLCAGASSKVLF